LKPDTIITQTPIDTTELNNTIKFWQMIDSVSCQAVLDSVKNWFLKHPVKIETKIEIPKIIKDTKFYKDTSDYAKIRQSGYDKAKKEFDKFDWFMVAFFVMAGIWLIENLYLLLRKK